MTMGDPVPNGGGDKQAAALSARSAERAATVLRALPGIRPLLFATRSPGLSL